MRAPHHRRTEKIGACLADPFANGEGRSEIDTFTIPEGRRRRGYRPRHEIWRKAGCRVNSKTLSPQRALPEMLGQLKANHFKVVHMVPMDQVTTLPQFDGAVARI
jgi:hypothetical protein